MASIFSKIVSGEIPAIKVYEDATTLAFMDINPATRGHTLVIPKDEHADLFAITVQRVALALRAVLQPDGINIIQNNGAAAGQTVDHMHVHLIPRWAGDQALRLWQPGQAAAAELRTIAEQLGAALAGA
jgi:histidine triad (HIT) family protein